MGKNMLIDKKRKEKKRRMCFVNINFIQKIFCGCFKNKMYVFFLNKRKKKFVSMYMYMYV